MFDDSQREFLLRMPTHCHVPYNLTRHSWNKFHATVSVNQRHCHLYNSNLQSYADSRLPGLYRLCLQCWRKHNNLLVHLPMTRMSSVSRVPESDTSFIICDMFPLKSGSRCLYTIKLYTRQQLNITSVQVKWQFRWCEHCRQRKTNGLPRTLFLPRFVSHPA